MEEFKQQEKFMNSNSPERMGEIEKYVEQYLKKYENAFIHIQGTTSAHGFWPHLESNWMRPVKEILETKLKGKTLVDLGCGDDDSNLPWQLKIPLKKFRAVDIDPPTVNNLTTNPDFPDDETKKEWNIAGIKRMQDSGIKDAEVVKDDILRYVTNLPDKSSNFFLSAIDDHVIMEEKYWEYLVEEIWRATENGGIVIDGGVGRIGDYIEKFAKGRFRVIFSQNKLEGQNIFEKIY